MNEVKCQISSNKWNEMNICSLEKAPQTQIAENLKKPIETIFNENFLLSTCKTMKHFNIFMDLVQWTDVRRK